MSMDQDNLVIYIGSFSKILPQGLRLGWIISPYSLIDRFYDVQIRHSAPANILTQLIVDELLSTGLYYEYLNSFKKRLEETSVFTSRIMKEHLTDLAQWSGLHPLLYWTRFNKKLSPEFMANNNIIPGTIFDEMSNQYTIISKLLFKEDEFEQRIIFLAEKLKEL